MKSECPGLDQWKLRQQLFWGQLPVSCLVAGQVLRQHLCKFSAFARLWSGFTWWLVTLLPPPLLFPSVPPPPPTAAPLSSLSLHSSRHNGWQTLVISRYSGPGGSGFPLVRIVLPVHFYGLVLHGWRILVQTNVLPCWADFETRADWLFEK